MTRYIIVTGLCGSGKTTYVKNLNVKNILHYDDIFNYKTSSLSYTLIDESIEKYKNNTEDKIYLDAYSNELITYLKMKDENMKISSILIYTDIDNYYDILNIKNPRDFIINNTYDAYTNTIIGTINQIQNSLQKLICETKYKYRTIDNQYIDYDNNQHLTNMLNTTKKDRLLSYIEKISGHSTYQSIILDNEYIKRGSEQDWLSFENILKCTSLKNKIICDTGCFNGYFSFKSLSEGAKKVIGIDHNEAAINICKKICIYNNYHLWKLGVKKDVSCELGIDFYLKKIGKDNIFDDINTCIDIIFALNYLHHLKNELGIDAFINSIDSFFKNSKEVIFEINEPEINDIEKLAKNNNFILLNKIESHRKTMFGNRWILHYNKIA